MTQLELPRRGGVVLVEQGLGVVRFVGDVDFDNKGTHIGIEIKGSTINCGHDGSLNGTKYFDIETQNQNNGLFIEMHDIIRTVTSEEMLAKLAALYDIVTGKVSNPHFVECTKYNDMRQQNQNLQQTVHQQSIRIQNLTKQNEALEAIKSNSGSHDTDSDKQCIINKAIDGKDEYQSDDTKQEDIDTDSIRTDDEPSPSPPKPHTMHQIIIDRADSPNCEETNDDDDDGIRDIEALSNISFKCLQSASATQSGTSKGKSKTNQDSYFMMDTFGPSSLFQLYGVCDGHGPNGNHVSQYVRDQLPIILNDLLTQSMHTLSITAILKATFHSIERQLNQLQQENALDFDVNYSGTTATIGLFAGNKLYVANVGDSRTVLGCVPPTKTVPIAIALSNDHDPSNSTEMIRINQSKSGRILLDEDDARIQIDIPEEIQSANLLSIAVDQVLPLGIDEDEDDDDDSRPVRRTKNKHQRTSSQVKKISASVSRSLGDKIAHEYGGLISEPEVMIHTLSDDDIFVIFASDGIWQMLDNEDVMRTVGTKLNQNKQQKIWKDLQKTTDKLVREANISWQDEYEDYTDDITCVITRIGPL
eukprot:179096_1